jgi:hypothetical protein
VRPRRQGPEPLRHGARGDPRLATRGYLPASVAAKPAIPVPRCARPMVPPPAWHIERPHAVGAHVAEGHWQRGLGSCWVFMPGRIATAGRHT